MLNPGQPLSVPPQDFNGKSVPLIEATKDYSHILTSTGNLEQVDSVIH